MALNVISNYAANVAHRHLTSTDMQATSSLAKLSSGSRVVSAKDDAAAMAIGSRLNAEVQSLRQATVNAGQAVSMLQIADGAMARVNDILVRMKTLSVQASSGQLGDTERGMLDTEYQALIKEVDRIAEDTSFNGTQLVAGGEVQTIEPNSLATHALTTTPGFASIEFDQSVDDAGFAVTWTNASDTLTLTNLKTGATESVAVGSAPITETQEVRFAQIGATITLSAAFDKNGANITTTGSAVTGAGTLVGTANLRGASLHAGNDFSGEALAAINSTAVTVSGTNNFATMMLTGAGTNNNFVLAEVNGTEATTIDLTTAGLKKVTLENARTGDRISFDLNITAGAAAVEAITLTLGELNNVALAAQDPDAGNFTFRLGTGTTKDVDTVTFDIDSITTKALGLTGTEIGTLKDAEKAIGKVGEALDTLNTARANVGASQNRLEFAAANLSTAIENSESARSSLLDLDVASEMTKFTSKQVLMQAGVAMLAQANQMPQNLLKLLG